MGGRVEGPPVCVVVLNWNRPEETIGCLDSLVSLARRGRLAMVICDNASSDDSVDQLIRWARDNFQLERFSELGQPHCVQNPCDWTFMLVKIGDNRGYAGGNNVGIRLALHRTCFEFIWILNNDTLVHADALDELESCARNNPELGIFGSTIVEHHRRDVVQTAGGCRYNPLTTKVSSLHAGRPLKHVLSSDNQIRFDYVSGAAMFCRAEVFRKVGLLDERFFLYYEELDLMRRMHSAGYDAGWCKDSIVYHKGAASTGGGSAINKEESWNSNYHENLSTLLYTRKHHPLYLPLVAMVRFLGKSFALLLRRRFRLFSALTTAYRDAFTGSRATDSTGSDARARIVVAGKRPEV